MSFASATVGQPFPSPFQLLKNKADVNFVNEHGNTPLHYACFWNYEALASDLIEWGALVSIENKYGETPLNKASGHMAKRLHGEGDMIERATVQTVCSRVYS